MVRFQRFLEIIEEENLVENAATVGRHLVERLRELETEFPEMLSNARGRGLFCAIDLPDTETRDLLRKECYERALMILAAGERSIRFRPPLNVSTEEIDTGIGIIRDALTEIVEDRVPAEVLEIPLPPTE